MNTTTRSTSLDDALRRNAAALAADAAAEKQAHENTIRHTIEAIALNALIETPDIVTITARQDGVDEIPTWAVELKDGTHIPLNDDPAYEALVEQLDELDHQILMNTPWLTGAYAIQDTMVVDRQTGTVGEVSFNVAAIGKDILEEGSP